MSPPEHSELKHASSMRSDEQPSAPSWQWRAASNFTMGAVGLLCKGFLSGLTRTEVHGLDGFLELLDERENIERRERGLITVSNHISVMDDPITWGVLPISYMFNVDNLRWGLGSYDLCFQNKALSTFFTLGQVLPTHRSAHSEHGGLFQPTMTQAIRLLSRGPFLTGNPPSKPDRSFKNPAISDPFSGGHLTFSTNGLDTFPSPSAYLNRRHSWVHIYPEGMIHQTQEKKQMRYFKWGVSRLILESDPIPDIVPMWIEGFDDVMDERRTFPRPLPRPFKSVSVTFGERLDGEEAFGDLREKWKKMRAREERKHGKLEVGDLTEGLKYSEEAVSLRKECTLRVRQAVLNLRRLKGYPDEDPKFGQAETWKLEGSKREGEKNDGSITKDT